MINRTIIRKEKKIKKTILVMAAILLGVTGWILMLNMGLNRTLLNPGFYMNLFDETEFYPRFHHFIFDTVVAGRRELAPEGAVVLGAIEEAFTTEWLRDQSHDVLEKMARFFKGEEDRLLVSLNLQERQAVFQEKLMEGIREFSPPQLEKLGLTALMVEEFVEQVEFPVALTLIEISGDDIPEIPAAIFLFQRKVFRYVPYLLSVLLIAMIIVWAGMPRACGWIGGSMLGSGLSFIAVYLAGRALVITPLLKRVLEKVAPVELFPDPELFLRSINDGGVFIIPVVFVAIGLALLIVGFISARRELSPGRESG